jgi:hypothetical protein
MKHPYACRSPQHTLSRRQLLGGLGGIAAAGAMGGFSSLIQPAFAAEIKKKRKQVILIWLDGGMSQLESWDPKPNTTFGGPFRAIPTSVPGVHFSELLEKTAKQMHHLAIVRGMHTVSEDHSTAVAKIERGDPKNRGVAYPYFGSACAKFLGPGDSKLPPYLWVRPFGGGFKYDRAGFLGPQYGALALADGKPPENLLRDPSISADVDAARNEFRKKADARFAKNREHADVDANSYAYDMAAQLMVRSDLFDTSKVDPHDIERYGTHELGRHILQARRLIEAGTTFVQVTNYHWDTHGDNFNLSNSMVPQLDQPFAALIEDLHARGMLDTTLVIAMSEFGRTPRINGNVGRDHWPEAWSVAMAGCGLAKGAVVGKTNDAGTWVIDAEYDVGHLFHTWFDAVGIDTTKNRYDNHGQPLPVANEDCQRIKELLV